MKKVISIRQPWAWLIVRPDIIGEEARALAYARDEIKPVENRTWQTHYRGEICIHAGKYVPFDDERRDIERRFHITLPASFEVGGIIGTANLVDCVAAHNSRWFFGPYGFVLADARPVPFTACPGRLGIYNLPDAQNHPIMSYDLFPRFPASL